MRPGDDEAATPVRRFVVVGEPAGGGSAYSWPRERSQLAGMAAACADADADAADGSRI